MLTKIGVRELKSQTSAIVRRVREESAEYVITHRGLPVARLYPIEQADIEKLQRQDAVENWQKLLELGRLLTATQQTEQSTVEILETIREEENRWPL